MYEKTGHQEVPDPTPAEIAAATAAIRAEHLADLEAGIKPIGPRPGRNNGEKPTRAVRVYRNPDPRNRDDGDP